MNIKAKISINIFIYTYVYLYKDAPQSRHLQVIISVHGFFFPLCSSKITVSEWQKRLMRFTKNEVQKISKKEEKKIRAK